MKEGIEYRLFGPPGTGKTTRLAETSIPKAIERYGSDRVVVTSFTRAAAREIAGRGIAVDGPGVGTLHSLCYRGLGFPELTVKHIKEWNADNRRYAILGAKVSSLDEGGGVDTEGAENSPGDKLLAQLNILRSKMVDPDKWPEDVKRFNDLWKMFKYSNNLLDFTDLIEETIAQKLPPPQGGKMMFVDEAQDLTPLQLKLVRMWGAGMKQYMLVGDDDQTIYSFTGASPDAFLKPPIDDSQKMILNQSYRVPRSVLERAMRLIKQVRFREKKEYQPRRDKHTGNIVEGSVSDYPENYTSPFMLLDAIENRIDAGKSCMVLTSCAYMLTDIRKQLISRRIPFGNEYRTTRGDWNPLAKGGGSRMTPRDLLYAFLTKGIDGDFWNVPTFLMWAKNLSVGETGLIYNQGNKVIQKLTKMVEKNAKGLHSCREVLGLVLTEKAIERAMQRDLKWFQETVKPKKQNPLSYPIEIYNKYKDIKVLERNPLVTIGTIHSVKGGQADVVFLYPDISVAAEDERQLTADGEDSLRRLFYVGMTRAKEELIVMSPKTKRRRGGTPVFYMEF